MEKKVLCTIYLNDVSKFNKKVLLSESLAKIRKIISEDLEENFSFLQKDKIIDVSEEGDLLLGKIIDNKKIFLTSNSNDSIYDIIMNDKIIQIKANKDEVLSSLRKKIELKISSDFEFLFNDSDISQKDENETTIEEILTNEKIYICSKTQEKNNLNTIKK